MTGTGCPGKRQHKKVLRTKLGKQPGKNSARQGSMDDFRVLWRFEQDTQAAQSSKHDLRKYPLSLSDTYSLTKDNQTMM